MCPARSRYREPVDADGWDQRYAGAELVWSAGPNRFVAEELADRPPGRVLDLASGEGRNALWLAARGWQATRSEEHTSELQSHVNLVCRLLLEKKKKKKKRLFVFKKKKKKNKQK